MLTEQLSLQLETLITKQLFQVIWKVESYLGTHQLALPKDLQLNSSQNLLFHQSLPTPNLSIPDAKAPKCNSSHLKMEDLSQYMQVLLQKLDLLDIFMQMKIMW